MAEEKRTIVSAKTLEFAGDYHLPYIHLHNHKGEGLSANTLGENISSLVVEMNIYESLFANCITGSLVIADTNNLISNLPIQGTERLSFRLSTKLENDTPHTTIDCTESGGHPMHIYALTDKQQIGDNMQTYVLHFASREFVRNLRLKVSEAFEGRMDQMVNKIFEDPDYLDSNKTLYYQKTRNQDKIVVPNLNPFAAIGMMCQRALPDNTSSKGAGYLFYETTKGFHFRSWESLCVTKGNQLRDAKQRFRYVQVMPSKQGIAPKKEDRVIEGYKNIENYKFTNNFHDVAANTALGTYGHRVITHNIYDKSYREDDYHYHNSFDDTAHAEDWPAIVDTPVDYDVVDGEQRQKGVSDYPEARVSLRPTTRFAHDKDTGHFGTEVTDDGILEGERVARINKIHSATKLEMTVKGQAWLQVGDIVDFDLQSVENRDNIEGSVLDSQYSGRYIITHIRHRVAQDQYKQVLTCVKDSVKNGFGYAGKSYTEIAGEPTVSPIFDIDDGYEEPAVSSQAEGAWHPGV
jgi:hypothetical protein